MGLRPRLSAAAASRLDSNPRALARYMFSRASARQGWGRQQPPAAERVTPRLRTPGLGSGSRANGSFPKGAGRLSEKSPARHPPPHLRGGIAWERGRPARILPLWPLLSFSAVLQAATPSAGTASVRPKEAMAPFPVDPSGGDKRGCAKLCAGGTPALPGSHRPMSPSHQGHEIAETFGCRLSLK